MEEKRDYLPAPGMRPVLTEHDSAEIDRRLAAYRADPSTAIPAEEFLEELERRYG